MPAMQRGRTLDDRRRGRCGRVGGVGIVAAVVLACGGATSLAQDSTRPGQPRSGSQLQPPRTTPARPGTQPGAQPARGAEMATQMRPEGAGLQPDDTYKFGPYAEPIELSELVDLIRQDLDLQLLYTDAGLKNQTVVVNTVVTLRTDQVLPFILTLLDQKDYTIVRDASGVHMVQPKGTIQANFGEGVLAPTKVIRTPGIKPSALASVVQSMISRGGAAGGAGIQFLDDLGLIVMTDTPRNTRLVEETVAMILSERGEVKFLRFEIHNIAASAARDRIIDLLGSTAGPQPARPQQPGQPAPAQSAAGISGLLSNLPERLNVDPGSNAVYFRGREDEATLLADLLALVDVPITLVARFYPVGVETAETVATEGSRQQLGEVTTFESSAGTGGVGLAGQRGALAGRQQPQPWQASSQNALSGSGFVIYPSAGGFIYRGTEAQHARVETLVQELGELIDKDTPVTEFYKLKYAKAEEVAESINGLITGQTPPGGRDSPLFGRDLGSRTSRSRPQPIRRVGDQPAADADPAAAAAAGGEEAVADLSTADVFVLADENNNQVVVRAPKRLQPQMKALIAKFDLLRPQVYIEAKIVTITVGDSFSFSAEVQQIIGQFALNTNFGLSTLGALTDRKEPGTGLPGLTTALIRSKDVPFVINAIQRNNEARVVATPQLLVDDNEEASVSSLDEQPFSTIIVGAPGQQNTTGFGGYETAGPTMRIKPQISDGGSVKLDYEIEISSFTGDATAAGPPPKRTDMVSSKSVTVPSDSTIVVGGLVFESVTEADAGIPLLMDIPFIGALFKTQTKNTRKTLLYVFVTPKVMRDTSFQDLRINTMGPMAAAKLEAEIPDAEPIRMELLDQNVRRTPMPDEGSLRRPPPPPADLWPAD